MPERVKGTTIPRMARGVEVCEVFCSDEQKVNRLKEESSGVAGLGNLFKALGDETRARIAFCLLREELCVCDVANVMGMSVQAVSHHLRVLRTTNLVKYRREGKQVFYSLDDAHVVTLMQAGMDHLREERR